MPNMDSCKSDIDIKRNKKWEIFHDYDCDKPVMSPTKFNKYNYLVFDDLYV